MRVADLKQRSVNTHSFAMTPRPDVPRASFPIAHDLKTAINFSLLYPIFCGEVLPGDHWNCRYTIVARTATPIVPIMDNWHLETFAFFVPNRILWDNWVKLQGEQDSPGDSIGYAVPTITSPVGGHQQFELYDYFGLPTVSQVDPAATITHNALPMRAYNQIWNQWFRDENLQTPASIAKDNGPDTASAYILRPRGKRFDYFTQQLPWPQKGNTAVTIPIGSTAPVIPDPSRPYPTFSIPSDTAFRRLHGTSGGPGTDWGAVVNATGNADWAPTTLGVVQTGLLTDLSTATAATINQLRTAFQIQKLLERDARGGTRYTEILRSHFGVVSPDARLQRPEYIGGGRMQITTNAIPQTSATGLTGGTTPAGSLAATGHLQGTNGFSYAATEHGFIIVLAAARADLTYQQGMHRMWSKSTRYDYYMPVFQGLGEQATPNKEIYCTGLATDNDTFGYAPRWDEYRYMPNRVTGLMRANATGNIGYWHSAELFASLPALNGAFIRDNAENAIIRNLAGGSLADNQQLIMDIAFKGKMARTVPAFGVPGGIDRF